MVSPHAQEVLESTLRVLGKQGVTAGKMDALAKIVSVAANLPLEVAEDYAIILAYWRMPGYSLTNLTAHEYTAEEQDIPTLCADAQATIDAAYALLFT